MERTNATKIRLVHNAVNTGYTTWGNAKLLAAQYKGNLKPVDLQKDPQVWQLISGKKMHKG
tara:strand:- start:565 stop:747 length:183 start_codon:yes stop_codon:yes gene_type:complete